MHVIIRHFVFILAALTALPTWGMVLDRVIVEFEPEGAQRQDVRVTNDKADNLYLNIDVLEVLSPGTEREERVPVKDPAASGILVTPAKMVVSPGSSKLVRIVNLNPESKRERVFRINFTPALAPLSTELDSSQVRVVIAYQVLVLMAPGEVNVALDEQRNGNRVNFTNTGNAYVYFVHGKQCNSVDSSCEDLPSRRLYPGNSWQLDLNHKAGFEYILQTYEGNKKRLFK